MHNTSTREVGEGGIKLQRVRRWWWLWWRRTRGGRVLILSDTSFTGHKTYTGRLLSGGWVGISEGVHSDDD